jgi:hypothetical protein
MRCGASGLPIGAADAGKVKDPAAVAMALKQLLARTEISDTRALVATSDAVATFRVLHFPANATDKEITAGVSGALPLNPETIARRWVDLATDRQQRTVYAVAWDRALVKNAIESVKLAGLEAVAVELKSACIARAVNEATCIVLDLSSDPGEIVLIDGHVPQVWHSFELKSPMGQDMAPALAAPVRSVLRFYKRQAGGEFGPNAPVLLAGEQVLPVQVLTSLAEMVQQPVMPLPPPPRVAPQVRHSTYLTCLGLIMRRGS